MRLTLLCFNKLPFIIIVIVVVISRCTTFSQQQRHSRLSNKNWLKPGQELVFLTTKSSSSYGYTTRSPATTSSELVVFVNNQPRVPTRKPFMSSATTPSPEFLDCFGKCQTTSEFNPICASNREVYNNEQKFNCAKYCGADIEIVRRGSCEGLFPMVRG